MSKKMILFFLVILFSFLVSIYFVGVSFNKVKYRYHEIEPNLDSYSAGEVLSLSFEKARSSLLGDDLVEYGLKVKVFGSKIKIIEGKSSLADSFYHSEEFLSHVDKLKKQYNVLKEINDDLFNEKISKDLVINYMNSVDFTINELLEIIYKIQIANFNEVKRIINTNSERAQFFSILSVSLGFLMVFVAARYALILRDSLRSKNLFISSIYHELASAAQTIVISADVIENEILQGELKTEAQRISYHTNKIIDQTKDIFDYSKLEIGLIGVHLCSFSLSKLCYELKQNFTDNNNNKLIIKSAYPRTVILSDKYKIYRIIINLIDNANKYTKGGFIYLNARIHDNNLIVRVKDTGEGFNITDLNNFYKAFNQGSEYTTRQGLGLGLTIIKSYVGILGGEIRVKSVVGIGSSFLISIPIKLIEE